MARFLVLEGVDGTGKTTQAERLVAWLQARGKDPLHLREPGSTRLGEQLRGLLLDPQRQQADPKTEALLFFAARRCMLQEQVQPALRAGRDVICERFTPSTLAYQGQEPDDAELVLALDRLLIPPHWQPEQVVILDLDPVESLARATQRAACDGFERRGIEFLQRVRQGYLAYAAARPQQARVLAVDGMDPQQVFDAVRELVGDWLLAAEVEGE